MKPTCCPTCGKEVGISGGGTEMEWDIEGRTDRVQGDFDTSWVCPFCHPEVYMRANAVRE